MKSIFAAALMLSAGILPVSQVAAQSADDGDTVNTPASIGDSTSTSNRWEVSAMPYLWAAGMKGTIGVPRTSGEIDIDQSFTDTLSDLKFAFMGTVDARHDRFVLLGDVLYLNVGAEVTGSRDPQFLTGKAGVATLVASGALGYRVIDQGPMFVDVFAGGRVISLDTDLDLVGPLATRSASANATTVDPLVGARLHAPLSPKVTLGLYGDVGSIVKGADVKWQLMGDLQYRLSENWTLLAGYRYMAINHSSAKFDFDINMSGPILGFSRRF